LDIFTTEDDATSLSPHYVPVKAKAELNLRYMKNDQHDALFSSVYCVIAPLHASGVSAAHHQEVECINVASGT
jgi:hypothetical protein